MGAGHPTYSSLNGVLFNKERTELILCPGGIAGNYSVPAGVTSIADGAFVDCRNLTNVTIPESVTSIGQYAFAECVKLAAFVIPDSVNTIERGTFRGCRNLSNITIGSGVTRIDWWAFSGCSALTGVVIPNNVNSIEMDAFSGCSSLINIVIPDGVTSIEPATFQGCSGLINIVIPDSVTSIGHVALGGCTSLNTIKIPNSVTGIGNYVFSGCTSLTSIVIPDSVTSIGGSPFSACTSLTGAYFEGRPPKVDWSPLGDLPLIVFYRPGTSGWGPTFAGHPTALWIDPPDYSDWLPSSGLLTQYPDASGEIDDPDQDDMSNYAEMLAGTDPTDPASVLVLESVPRPADLSEADRTPLAANQHAIYFRTVPGKQYGIQWNDSLSRDPGAEWWAEEGLWRTVAVVTATTPQTRFVFNRPATKAFYRVLLAQ